MARRCSLFQTASMILALGKLLLRAGWAPAAVLMFHAVVAKTVWREPLDFTIHFLGGAAIAYFFFYALQYLERLVGPTSGFGRYLFAYALACAEGLNWEFVERFYDVYLHTHIQQSVQETMSDLIGDACGAASGLLLLFLVRCLCRASTPALRPSFGENAPVR